MVKRRSFLAGTGAVAAGLTFSKFLPTAFGAEEKKLNFYNWDTYIGPNSLSDFQKQTGISVKMDIFANNDELFNKIKNKNPGYDVIVPTNDFVAKMVKLNLLIPLDYSKIPNSKNAFASMKNLSFDPGRKYSLTYTWGTFGIGYRKSKVKGKIDSWKVLLDSDEYKGRIGLFGEASSLIPIGLKYLGYSINDTDPKHLKEVEDLLIKQKKNVKIFHNDDGQDLLLSKEIDLVMEFSGDMKQVIAKDPDLDYVVPKEGTYFWYDNLAIPKGAKHVENAHAFINFIYDAKFGKDIATEIQYATPNEAAYQLMPESYRKDPTIYPNKEVMDRCEIRTFKTAEFDQKLDAVVTRVKAS